MKVTDCLDHLSASSKDGQGCAILSNRKGGFAVISPSPSSRYDGVFAMRRPGDVFKFIESIEHDDPVLEVVNKLLAVDRRRKSFTESLIMPGGFNAILYGAGKRVDVRLVLDCKHAYDNREWGRHYSVEPLPQGALISYSKMDDGRDLSGSQDSFGEYEMFVAIHSPEGTFAKDERWLARDYPRDSARNSHPSKRHVFSALSISAESFTVGFGFTKAEAISSALKAWIAKDDIIRIEESRVMRWRNQLPDSTVLNNLAFACAANSLDCLIVGKKNVYAGLPWFFQSWARDSAVSAKGLSIIGRKEVSRQILLDQVSKVVDGVSLPVFFAGNEGNPAVNPALDGVLWTYFRLEEMLDEDPAVFTKEEISLISSKLSETIDRLDAAMRDGLVHNGPKETWMDTEWGGDTRAGARIEMQCLALAAMRFAKKLGVQAPCASQLQKTTKAVFWNGNYLNDGKDDPTIRPNVFIAAYVYPDLLTNKEWASCFDHVLPKLWLDWGGLATIAKDHHLFTGNSTGEDVKSYHRGDSWFWVNNLAAIVMRRTYLTRYKKYIEAILDASTKELLFMGAVGHHAELSSASHLSSEGCLAQAWSDALYLELLVGIFNNFNNRS